MVVEVQDILFQTIEVVSLLLVRCDRLGTVEQSVGTDPERGNCASVYLELDPGAALGKMLIWREAPPRWVC